MYNAREPPEDLAYHEDLVHAVHGEEVALDVVEATQPSPRELHPRLHTTCAMPRVKSVRGIFFWGDFSL